ncbi:MAG: dihydropteroate synthase [Coprothermobacterota bacterium]|nr:dihydropteroate synthase [Coprothermobacterota bacterium]
MLPPVFLSLRTSAEIDQVLHEIGVHPQSLSIMRGKGQSFAIRFSELDPRAANVLKQEMLARGGEAAISWKALNLNEETTDVLLFGTLTQLRLLVEKLTRQPFGLKELATMLERSLRCQTHAPSPASFGRWLFPWGQRTYLMGILNLTPDSFSGDGIVGRVDAALARADELIREGADLLDVGGESSRPGHTAVSAQEEWNRLKDFLAEFLPHAPIPVSLDTNKAEVAQKGLEAGVHLINDIWGLKKERAIAKLVQEAGAGLVLQHNRAQSDYKDLLSETLADLTVSIQTALDEGMDEKRLIIDPGIGFGKKIDQNFTILKHLAAFRSLGYPLMVGPSRKSFLGQVTCQPPAERVFGTAAAVCLAVTNGADLVRVHDVKAMKDVIQVCDRTIRAV